MLVKSQDNRMILSIDGVSLREAAFANSFYIEGIVCGDSYTLGTYTKERVFEVFQELQRLLEIGHGIKTLSFLSNLGLNITEINKPEEMTKCFKIFNMPES